jgi:hypothetical protein
MHGRSGLARRVLPGYGVTVCVRVKRLSAPLTSAKFSALRQQELPDHCGAFKTPSIVNGVSPN